MADWTFRVLGAAPSLNPPERRQIEAEIVRLARVVGSLPGTPLVQVQRNPAGILGEYVILLMDGLARGVSRQTLLPPAIQQRYGDYTWYAISVEVLDAFSAELETKQPQVADVTDSGAANRSTLG